MTHIYVIMFLLVLILSTLVHLRQSQSHAHKGEKSSDVSAREVDPEAELPETPKHKTNNHSLCSPTVSIECTFECSQDQKDAL